MYPDKMTKTDAAIHAEWEKDQKGLIGCKLHPLFFLVSNARHAYLIYIYHNCHVYGMCTVFSKFEGEV